MPLNRCHRERKIVLLAAERVSGSTRTWLRSDEHGVFEKQARELLDGTAERAQGYGLTDQQVDEQISVYIALLATEAQINSKG